MKAELYIRNSKNKLFKMENNIQNHLTIKDNDLIIDRDKTGHIEYFFEAIRSQEIIETFKSNEDAEKVHKYLYNKLKEQKDLKMEIQVMKKMKGLSQSFIDNYRAKLRNEYFEFSILDICEEIGIEL